MKKRFPEFIADITREVEDYLICLKGKASKEEIYYLTYIYFSTWSNLVPNLLETYKKIKVLIISKYHQHHAISIRDQIKLLFNNFIDVHLYEDEEFSIKSINEGNYDVVLSDFTLPKDLKVEWLYLLGNQSYNDLESIIRIFYNKFFELNYKAL